VSAKKKVKEKECGSNIEGWNEGKIFGLFFYPLWE